MEKSAANWIGKLCFAFLLIGCSKWKKFHRKSLRDVKSHLKRERDVLGDSDAPRPDISCRQAVSSKPFASLNGAARASRVGHYAMKFHQSEHVAPRATPEWKLLPFNRDANVPL